jgi:hypothetical protein
LACGEIGLKIDEFYNLTPRQFNNIVIGYNRKENNHVKLQMQLFRDLEFAVLSPYFDKKQGIKKPQDYKAFVWEKPQIDNSKRIFKSKKDLASIFNKVDKNKDEKQ